jgi:hypothetical protein
MLINQWMLLKFGWETREDNDPAWLHGLHVCFSDNFCRLLFVGMAGRKMAIRKP